MTKLNQPKEDIGTELHIKWLSKAETAIIRGNELTVLPYGYVSSVATEAYERGKAEALKPLIDISLQSTTKEIIGGELYAMIKILRDKKIK